MSENGSIKTVGELFHSLNKREVLAQLYAFYPKQMDNAQGYEEAWDEILGIESVVDDPMVCELYFVKDDEHPQDSYTSVHGRDANNDTWAIEYSPWKEWLGMKVTVQPECGNLTDNEVLAHILFEMTWAGYTQKDVQDQLKTIMDTVDEIKEQYDDSDEEE